MHVKHLLAGGRAVRLPEALALGLIRPAYGARHPHGGPGELRGCLLVEVVEACDVGSRQHQNVAVVWLAEVDDGDGQPVLEYEDSWDLPGGRLAEDAMSHALRPTTVGNVNTE